MNWITLAEADVLAGLNNAELAAYRNVAAQSGQADPLATVLGTVTDEIRAACAKRNRLNVTGLPASLRNTALDIIIYRLANRVGPQFAGPRQAAHDEALERLAGVEDGRRAIEKPDTAADPIFSGPALKLSSEVQARRFTREQTDGL